MYGEEGGFFPSTLERSSTASGERLREIESCKVEVQH